METNFWFVYLAQSETTGRIYTGITTNPSRRLDTHNKGNGSKFAIDQGPLKLVYVSEPYKNKSEARIREVQIKGWRQEKKKWLIDRRIV